MLIFKESMRRDVSFRIYSERSDEFDIIQKYGRLTFTPEDMLTDDSLRMYEDERRNMEWVLHHMKVFNQWVKRRSRSQETFDTYDVTVKNDASQYCAWEGISESKVTVYAHKIHNLNGAFLSSNQQNVEIGTGWDVAEFASLKNFIKNTNDRGMDQTRCISITSVENDGLVRYSKELCLHDIYESFQDIDEMLLFEMYFYSNNSFPYPISAVHGELVLHQSAWEMYKYILSKRRILFWGILRCCLMLKLRRKRATESVYHPTKLYRSGYFLI